MIDLVNSFDQCRELAVTLLTKSELSSEYIDHLFEASKPISRLSSRDRALLQNIVYGVLRQKTYLDLILKHYIRQGFEGFQARLKNILRSAVYQIVFLDRVPNYAAVSAAVTMAKRGAGRDKAPLVNGVLRNYIRNPFQPAEPDANSSITDVAAYHNHPDWLVERFVRQFGQTETLELVKQNNVTPEVILKYFGKRSKALKVDGIEKIPDIPGFYKLTEPTFLHSILAKKGGGFIVQDPSAGFATALADLKIGEQVLDLCAAPGGKTIAMAKAVAEKGKVAACDLSAKRVQKLRQNIERMQIKNVSVLVSDARTLVYDPVDVVLIDAPCSGVGVLAKRADLRWKRKPEDFKNLIELQREILENAAKLVKPGGRLIYSTCSIDREENDDQIEHFLSNHKDFVLESAADFVNEKFVSEEGFVKTAPHKHPGFDGSFAARLRRI